MWQLWHGIVEKSKKISEESLPMTIFSGYFRISSLKISLHPLDNPKIPPFLLLGLIKSLSAIWRPAMKTIFPNVKTGRNIVVVKIFGARRKQDMSEGPVALERTWTNLRDLRFHYLSTNGCWSLKFKFDFVRGFFNKSDRTSEQIFSQFFRLFFLRKSATADWDSRLLDQTFHRFGNYVVDRENKYPTAYMETLQIICTAFRTTP